MLFPKYATMGAIGLKSLDFSHCCAARTNERVDQAIKVLCTAYGGENCEIEQEA